MWVASPLFCSDHITEPTSFRKPTYSFNDAGVEVPLILTKRLLRKCASNLFKGKMSARPMYDSLNSLGKLGSKIKEKDVLEEFGVIFGFPPVKDTFCKF